jgi:hypothetical protein
MMTALDQEADLRLRIRDAANAMRGSWTPGELRALTTLLESIVADRRRIDTVGNVAWLGERRQ